MASLLFVERRKSHGPSRILSETKQVGHLRAGPRQPARERDRASRRISGRRVSDGEDEKRRQEAGVFRDVACAVYANWARVNARLSGCPGRDLTSPRTGSSFYLLRYLHRLPRRLFLPRLFLNPSFSSFSSFATSSCYAPSASFVLVLVFCWPGRSGRGPPVVDTVVVDPALRTISGS